MQSLIRKPLCIVWAVLGLLFLFTEMNLNLLAPQLWLWQSNWVLVLLSPVFIIVLLLLAFKKRGEKIAKAEVKNKIAKISLCLGKVISWLMIIPVFLFLLIATGTKYGQLDIETRVPVNYSSVISIPDHHNLLDARGEIHVHSSLSWDSDGKIEEIAMAAKKNGVRWIIFTDHVGHLPAGVYPDSLYDVTLIYGQERSHRIGDKQCGSALRASLKDPERNLELYGHIEKYAERGSGDYDRWDGIELVSFHANARSRLSSLLGKLITDPTDFYPMLTRPTKTNLEHWLWRAKQEDRPIPIFAAPDAHQNMGILGMQTDPYEFIFKMVSTHIWIDKDESLNQESIFRAIKKGRTYIAFDYLGDPTGFQFHAVVPGTKFYTGDTVSQPIYIVVRVPPGECKVKFFCDNQPVNRGAFFSEGRDWIVDPQPGFWRVEIWRDGKPWIISGQILVK